MLAESPPMQTKSATASKRVIMSDGYSSDEFEDVVDSGYSSADMTRDQSDVESATKPTEDLQTVELNLPTWTAPQRQSKRFLRSSQFPLINVWQILDHLLQE